MPPLNAKKAKKRQKALEAKARAGQIPSVSGDLDEDEDVDEPPAKWQSPSSDNDHGNFAEPPQETEVATTEPGESKKSKKKKKKAAAAAAAANAASSADLDTVPGSETERQQIREYWLNLHQDERKALVQIEKKEVLSKLRSQQPSACNCSLCGRHRHNVEADVVSLYEEYYRELEAFAIDTGEVSHAPTRAALARTALQPPGEFARQPDGSRMIENLGEDDSLGDDYSDVASHGDYSLNGDGDPLSDDSQQGLLEYFGFGDSLRVEKSKGTHPRCSRLLSSLKHFLPSRVSRLQALG
jgi:hypothetical protein